jgi:NADH-quinone oxidoreductase subunit N
MAEKLWFLIPELILFAGVVVVSVIGLSPRKVIRDSLPLITCLFLAAALAVTPALYSGEPGARHLAGADLLMPMLGKYVKVTVCLIGIVLVMTCSGMVDRRYEQAVQSGRLRFDPMRAARGEFYAFILLSLIGVMLICNANDLIWLFLALELTSLPTYIMVAISRSSRRAQEASVKYFFLGAMAAAIFLYGFALLYGATGTIVLTEMRQAFAEQAAGDGVSIIGIVGMILAVLGVSFKIAAAPMHFYAPDVYEGAASPVTAFLAFVPKTAGFLALMLLLGTMGWSGHFLEGVRGLPQPILTTLWMLAVLTMTLGNIGALLQRSVKRMLAYSSIAHSGYMLIGIIAGPGLGLNAVLFYLLAYGLMNTGAFAVLAALERNGQEIETAEDLAGLRLKHPAMAVVMAICAGSLLGLPPLLGFFGKLYLFMAGVQAGQIELVVVAGLNSAISAAYYLRLVTLPIMAKPSAQAETIVPVPSLGPRAVGVLTSILLVVLPVVSAGLIDATRAATRGYAQTSGNEKDAIGALSDSGRRSVDEPAPAVSRPGAAGSVE